MHLVKARKALGRLGRRVPVVSGFIAHRRRAARLAVLHAMPRGSVCAEIGVWRGSFSALILEIVAPRRLHLIDPWEFHAGEPETWEGGRLARTQEDMDQVFQGVARRFAAHPEVTIHRVRSEDAVRLFAEGELDWVYVDGDHHYQSVRADLELYLPAVSPGGFIAGDDYFWGPELGLPVKQAVNEVVANGSLEMVFLRGSQYILRKPAA